MRISTDKIEGFENMTADEKVAALLGLEIETDETTPAEITKLKSALSKANSEAADFKRKLHEKLSDEEKAKAEAEAAQKELNDKYAALLKESTISKNTARYTALGMSVELASAAAEAAFDGDNEKVFECLGRFKSDMEKAIRADILDRTPRPNSKGSGKSTTKEQFDKMSYAEREKLFNEDRELYNELKK